MQLSNGVVLEYIKNIIKNRGSQKNLTASV